MMEKLNKENKIIIMLTFVIAISGILTYTSLDKQTKAIEGSYLPQIYYKGSCPKNISNSSVFLMEFGNYGKIPVKDFFIRDLTDNIISLVDYGEGKKDIHQKRGVVVPLEYKNNEQSRFLYELSIENYNKSNATFIVEWLYTIKEGHEDNQKIICYYEKSNETFILEEKGPYEKVLLYKFIIKRNKT